MKKNLNLLLFIILFLNKFLLTNGNDNSYLTKILESILKKKKKVFKFIVIPF